MILVTSPVSDFSVLMQTGSGRPATGRSDAAGLRHVLHAAAAQYRHTQEEAQHQTIQGSPIDVHLWHCFTFAFISFSLRCLKKICHILDSRWCLSHSAVACQSGALGRCPSGSFWWSPIKELTNASDPKIGPAQPAGGRCWYGGADRKTLATWQHMLAMGSELTAVVFVGLSLQDAQRLAFDEKLQAYNEVCTKFRPVFRYFCMERFLDPAVWMEKRLAYTRSVATSSIGTPSHRVKLIMYCKYKMPQTEGRHIIDVT